MNLLKKYLKVFLKLGIISWIFLLSVWIFISSFYDAEFLPSPIETILGAKELIIDGTLIHFIFVSLKRVLVGWCIGNIIAIPVGIIIGRIEGVKQFIEPFIDFFRFIPAIAFITLFIMWFGIGEESKIMLIIYATGFASMINTVSGVLSIDKLKIQAARSLGANEMQIVFHIIIPAALPYIFTGIRLGMGNAFMAIVGAEMIAAKEGIGYLIFTSRMYFRTDWIFVGLISLGLMGYFSDRILQFIGVKVLKKYGIKKETQFNKN